jgi:hypothetical protein
MPKCFDTWNVLPHRPLEKLEPNLWRVEGDLPGGRGTRVMTVARMRDGGLLIHNAIALEDALMAELEAFGRPAVMVVPNGLHRLDAKVFKQRYPQLKVVAPARSREKVGQVVAVDHTYTDAPRDEDVRLFHFEGTQGKEGALEVKSDGATSVVVNDVICNAPRMGGIPGFLLAPTGIPSIPRFARWMLVKDRATMASELEAIASTTGLRRVILSHGPMLDDDPATVLRSIASTLRS